MPQPAIERVASVIDHTLLDASAGAGAIDQLCAEASRYGFAAVCVHGRWVARCAGRTGGAAAVAAVVSFPHGLDATAAKADAARRAVADGADELDVVIAPALLDEDPAAVPATSRRSSRPPPRAAGGQGDRRGAGALRRQLERACAIVAEAGAAFAKTGTGTQGPATVEQVRAMRRHLPARVRIKASGGIRTADAGPRAARGRRRPAGDELRVAIMQQLDVHAVA